MASSKKDTEKDDLRKEVKELNLRIGELEQIITELQEPLRQMRTAAKGYYKFIDLFMKYGGVSPDKIVPGMKDSISKEIINILFDRNGQNISQITEVLRNRRGSASRRIVRDKLAKLEEAGLVIKKKTKKSVEYYISEKLVKKWSQVLGFNI
jgi:DNA-binding transcriptional ArsR family regulator